MPSFLIETISFFFLLNISPGLPYSLFQPFTICSTAGADPNVIEHDVDEKTSVQRPTGVSQEVFSVFITSCVGGIGLVTTLCMVENRGQPVSVRNFDWMWQNIAKRELGKPEPKLRGKSVWHKFNVHSTGPGNLSRNCVGTAWRCRVCVVLLSVCMSTNPENWMGSRREDNRWETFLYYSTTLSRCITSFC